MLDDGKLDVLVALLDELGLSAEEMVLVLLKSGCLDGPKLLSLLRKSDGNNGHMFFTF